MFDHIEKLWDPLYTVFWAPFCDVWRIGADYGLHFLGAVILLLTVAQICWTIWRYIDDADKYEARTVGESEIRRAVSGSLLDNDFWGTWRVRRNKAEEFYTFVIIVVLIGGGVSIAAWPFLLAVGTMYGLLQAARGTRRLQKLLKKAMTKLKKKAEKDHNHDGAYVRRDAGGTEVSRTR